MAVLDTNQMMFQAFQPKTPNRFLFYVDGIPTYLIKKASIPSFTAGEIKLDHINTYRKVQGKTFWGDVSLTLYDPIAPSGSQAVIEWIRLGYESVTGRAGYSDFYKKDCSMVVLGPVGDIVSEWLLKGAFIKTSNFGEYDWSSGDSAIELKVDLSIDYAILNW